METIKTFDNPISFDSSKRYNLTFEIGNGTMTYVILDIDENKYIALKHVNFNSSPENEYKEIIKKLIDEDSNLSYNFQSTIFQYRSFRAMLVPETLFDSNNLKSFLKFHHDIEDKDHIRFIELKPAEAFVIFAVPVPIEEIICLKFPHLIFAHPTVPFIYNALVNRDKNESLPCIHVNFAIDFFDILIIRNNKIQLYNSFFYKKYTDVLYFIVNILNLFSIKPDNTKVYISGDIEEKSELELELEKIFKVISLEKYNLDFQFVPEFSNLSQHRFINLINLYHCVL